MMDENNTDSDEESKITTLESELYFLIVKFLQSGSCKESAKRLIQEINEKKILPKGKDWTGTPFYTTFDQFNQLHNQIGDNHLLKICQRLPALLDEKLPPPVSGVKTFLGTGRQSLLRTKETQGSSSYHELTIRSQCRPIPLTQCSRKKMNIYNYILGREYTGRILGKHTQPVSLFANIRRQKRSLGHLSAVYCVTYDRNGQYIITGADDHLVKIWSAQNGRLIRTLRGHLKEITDMAVSYDNTILATGSCDKTVRIWSTINFEHLAVLHGHTSPITSLQFCPLVRKNTSDRYFMSTGEDGNVCYWYFNNDTKIFNPKPIKFIERSRAGVQMLCSSFSPGGIFLVTGSSDNTVRVYCFTSVPSKIAELEAHTAAVDSIQYGHNINEFLSGSSDGTARIWKFSNDTWKNKILKIQINDEHIEYAKNCDKFVSGSWDGTARIWKYQRQQWKAVVLKVNSDNDLDTDLEKKLLKITMVAWTCDDLHVLTAVSDFSVKFWRASSGQLISTFVSHTTEVFVLETHPTDPLLMLSAGHDGSIIIWDLQTETKVYEFINSIEGQGHGAVLDGKWSKDGMSFVCTDAHGHLSYFGFDVNDVFDILPNDLFFHTDYRPLIHDANGFVLDEQTQMLQHQMPAPFLVDMNGMPYPPNLQRYVPGREKAQLGHLLPQIAVTPSGDREVLDVSLADTGGQDVDIAVGDNLEIDYNGRHANLDVMIAQLQRIQDERVVAEGGVLPEAAAAEPGMDEIIRPHVDHDYVGLARRTKVDKCSNSFEKRPNYEYRECERARKRFGEIELESFLKEAKKKPIFINKNEEEDAPFVRSTRKRAKARNISLKNRNANEETSVNRLTTRALYDTEVESSDSNHESEIDHPTWKTSDEGRDYEMASSDYSDWAPNPTKALEPPKTTNLKKVKPVVNVSRPKRIIKTKTFSEDEENKTSTASDSDTEVSDNNEHKEFSVKCKPKNTQRNRRIAAVKAQQKRKRVEAMQNMENGEIPPLFRPPEWLTTSIPRRTPYVPQMGDDIMYFRQGHELYVNAVERLNVYKLANNTNVLFPWIKDPDLSPHEWMRVIGIKFEIKPPRLVCLKLGHVDNESAHLTGESFTLKYHDMPDVIDFLVLRKTYVTAMERQWKEGDRFRAVIDDAWWHGTIETHIPLNEDFPHSHFQCLSVKWDNGETELMSPWDLEPEVGDPPEGGSIPVTQAEFRALQYYQPDEDEWPPHGRDVECDRIREGIERVMELSVAEHFIAPVDLSAFPYYAMVIPYLIDLSTIRARLENRFYRRVTSILKDVRFIESNAKLFNESGSIIVRNAELTVRICVEFIQKTDCINVMTIYAEIMQEQDSLMNSLENVSDRTRRIRRRLSSATKISDDHWKHQCRNLIDRLLTHEDSYPFREAVDPEAYPDYYQIVDQPMHLQRIKEKLVNDEYVSLKQFSADVRLVFSNSRAYNTNKRSRVYAMTLRLSAYFDEQIKAISLECIKPSQDIIEVKKQSQRRLSSITNNIDNGPSTSREGNSSRTTQIANTSNNHVNNRQQPKRQQAQASSYLSSDATDTENIRHTKRQRIQSPVRKPPMRAVRHKNSFQNSNGVYSTRINTGSIKRKVYDSDTTEYSEHEESDVDTEDDDIINNENHDNSKHSLSSHSSDTELNEDNYEDDIENEESVSDNSDRAMKQKKRKPPTPPLQKLRRISPRKKQRKLKNSPIKNGKSVSPNKNTNNAKIKNSKASRSTRNMGKRTVTYDDETEDEENEVVESISSRGRLRKVRTCLTGILR